MKYTNKNESSDFNCAECDIYNQRHKLFLLWSVVWKSERFFPISNFHLHCCRILQPSLWQVKFSPKQSALPFVTPIKKCQILRLKSPLKMHLKGVKKCLIISMHCNWQHFDFDFKDILTVLLMVMTMIMHKAELQFWSKWQNHTEKNTFARNPNWANVKTKYSAPWKEIFLFQFWNYCDLPVCIWLA